MVTEEKPASAKGYIQIDRELCKGCDVCIFFCPRSAIRKSGTLNANGYEPAAFEDGAECNGCAICGLVCPEVAIEVFRG